MEPAWGMAALWVLFGGTHIGLATRAVREPLVKRSGEIGFSLLFSLVAVCCTSRPSGTCSSAAFCFVSRWRRCGATAS